MKILAIGAHPDDIELHCGGLLLNSSTDIEKHSAILTLGETRLGNRYKEQMEALEYLNVNNCTVGNFKDGELSHNLSLVNYIDDLILEVKPNLILSHSLYDVHQDHLAIAKAVKSAIRGGNIAWITYNYCSIKNISNFETNCIFTLPDFLYKKKKELLSIFKSQQDRWYFKEVSKYELFKIEYLNLNQLWNLN